MRESIFMANAKLVTAILILAYFLWGQASIDEASMIVNLATVAAAAFCGFQIRALLSLKAEQKRNEIENQISAIWEEDELESFWEDFDF